MRTCNECKFYIPYRNADMKRGECRRYPPTSDNEFPVVKEDDWCGELAV